MVIAVRVLAGVLLAAHGLVHLLYLAPSVPEFSLSQSWLFPEPARRPVGLVLMIAVVAAFALVALAVWGVPGLAGVWPRLTVAACLLSAGLPGVFWDTALLAGISIDAVLLLIVLTRPAWADRLVG